MVRHVDRCMVEMGVAPKVNGPLFLRLRAKMAPHMIRPQSLMSISRTRIRAAILNNRCRNKGLKRLPQRILPSQQQLTPSVGANKKQQADATNTTTTTKHKLSSVTATRVCQLKLPQKISRYICLGEEFSSDDLQSC